MSSWLSELGSNLTDLPGLDASVLQGLLNSGLDGGTNGGIDYDDQGAPIMLRDSHIASLYSTANNLWMTGAPRPKFTYFINFVSATPANSLVDVLEAGPSLNSLSYVVNSIDKPSIVMTTKTLNQYNKKRIIHTGREYKPINCTFWDTADNNFYNIFLEYFKFYYGDSNNYSATAWVNDTTAAQYQTGANGWGYVIPANSTATTDSFLDRIEVYEMAAGYYRVYELVNPRFRDVKFDKLDYNEGNTLSKVSAEIEYEGVNFLTTNVRVNDDSSLTTAMQTSASSFYEPTSMSVPNVGLDFAPSATFNDLAADTSYVTQEDDAGLGSAYSYSGTMSAISGNSGIFNQSGIGIIGNFLTQNSGTITQAIGNNSSVNSLTRGLSILGGLY